MKIIDVKLDTVCGYTSTLPVLQEPEIAFAGRSNVGKSSLINVLMKRKRLARVGETPGKTRTINFYKVTGEMRDPDKPVIYPDPAAGGAPGKKLRWKNDPAKNKGVAKKTQAVSKPVIPTIRKTFFLVDLPGYGYANVSEDEKARWGHMIENYLNSSPGLLKVFLLVDIRHEPNANDIQMYDWVTASGFTPVIIATKADKLSKSQIDRQIEVIGKALGAPKETRIIAFSALTGQGAAEIYRVIEEEL